MNLEMFNILGEMTIMKSLDGIGITADVGDWRATLITGNFQLNASVFVVVRANGWKKWGGYMAVHGSFWIVHYKTYPSRLLEEQMVEEICILFLCDVNGAFLMVTFYLNQRENVRQEVREQN